jgi:phosphocarrier protein HPr
VNPLFSARTLTICNRLGLHARSSAKFVKCVERYHAQVTVRREGNEVSGASIMGLLMLGAAKGAEIEVFAEGEDAIAVLDALEALVNGAFGED